MCECNKVSQKRHLIYILLSWLVFFLLVYLDSFICVMLLRFYKSVCVWLWGLLGDCLPGGSVVIDVLERWFHFTIYDYFSLCVCFPLLSFRFALLDSTIQTYIFRRYILHVCVWCVCVYFLYLFRVKLILFDL